MRTTDCVKWSRWGYKRDDHCAEHNARVEWTYIGGERVEQNALPMQPKVFRKWKERYKLKDDELPGASFILAKRRLNDPTAPFDREGQVFSLRNGTQKRVYWKYSRNPTVIDNGTPSSLESNLESGLWKLGRLEAPSDQISVDYAPEDLPPDDVEITATAARRADGGCDSDRSGRCRRRKHKNYVESNSSDEDELNSSDEDELNSSDEEEQEVTESELEKCVSESSDEFSSSDGEDEIQFKVGEKVRNIHGLNGIVTAVNGKLYDVTYIDGRTDRLKSLYLRPQVVRNKVGSNRTMTAGSYTYVAHDDQWVDSGSIRADNVVAGKRKRASVTSYRT